MLKAIFFVLRSGCPWRMLPEGQTLFGLFLLWHDCGLFEALTADTQNRDGAVPTLQASRKRFPFIEKVFADSGYASEPVAQATCITPEIIRKPKRQIGFAVQPRR